MSAIVLNIHLNSSLTLYRYTIAPNFKIQTVRHLFCSYCQNFYWIKHQYFEVSNHVGEREKEGKENNQCFGCCHCWYRHCYRKNKNINIKTTQKYKQIHYAAKLELLTVWGSVPHLQHLQWHLVEVPSSMTSAPSVDVAVMNNVKQI